MANPSWLMRIAPIWKVILVWEVKSMGIVLNSLSMVAVYLELMGNSQIFLHLALVYILFNFVMTTITDIDTF